MSASSRRSARLQGMSAPVSTDVDIATAERALSQAKRRRRDRNAPVAGEEDFLAPPTPFWVEAKDTKGYERYGSRCLQTPQRTQRISAAADTPSQTPRQPPQTPLDKLLPGVTGGPSTARAANGDAPQPAMPETPAASNRLDGAAKIRAVLASPFFRQTPVSGTRPPDRREGALNGSSPGIQPQALFS